METIIHNRTPAINYDDFLREQKFDTTVEILLREDHSVIPRDIKTYTPKIKRGSSVSEIMVLPPLVVQGIWESIITGNVIMGPKIVRNENHMKEMEHYKRGNYIVISNHVTNEILFVYAPVFEKKEAFAKHRYLFKYCFETNLISDNNWNLWGVGEFTNEIKGDGIHINSFSGTYREKIEQKLENKHIDTVKSHYNDVSKLLSSKYNIKFTHLDSSIKGPETSKYEDLDIKCEIIPREIKDFNTGKCYRYNSFVGLGDNNMYKLFSDGKTFESFIDEDSTMRDIKMEGVETKDLSKILISISLMNLK